MAFGHATGTATDAVEDGSASTLDDPDDVVYTEDEIDDNDALVVRAKSDGDQQSVNLHLEETDLFDRTLRRLCSA